MLKSMHLAKNRINFALTLLLLLSASWVIFAASIVLPDGSVYENPSLQSVPLNMTCRKFWESSEWNPNEWYDFGILINQKARIALYNLEIDSWDIDEAGETSKLAFLSKSEAKKIKDAYEKAVTARQKQNIITEKMPRIENLSIVETPQQILYYYLSYENDWKIAMDAATSALSYASEANDIAFSDAQQKADKLAFMGAEDPAYTGGARKAIEEWDSFVNDVNYYARQELEIGRGQDITAAFEYAYARQVLTKIQQVCDNPKTPLPFNEAGHPFIAFSYLTSSTETRSLIQKAKYFQKELSNAIGVFEKEVNLSKDDAEAQYDETKKVMDKLKKAEWYSHFSLPARKINATLFDESEWAALGDYGSRFAAANDAFVLAGENKNAAQKISREKNSLWAIRSISYYNRSSLYSKYAYKIASDLLEDMQTSVQSIADEATKSTQELKAIIDSAYSSAGFSASSLRSAKSALTEAESNITLAQDEDPAHLGAKYKYYSKALSAAKFGLRILQGGSKAASEDLDKMRLLLADLKKRISWAEKLGIEDIRQFKDAYYEFDSQLANATPQEGVLDLLQERIDALNARMNFALSDEEEQYQELKSAIYALAPYSSGKLGEFREKWKPYRNPQGGWSDFAFEKGRENIANMLEKSKKEVNSALAQVLPAVICSNAQWAPLTSLDPSANERTNVGGTWLSSNPLDVEVKTPLEIKCPLAAPNMQGADVEYASKNVNKQTVSVSSSSLSFKLFGLEPQESIEISFSSLQQPFTFSQESCQLTIDEGLLSLEANYRLQADYSPKVLRLSVPWADSLQISKAIVSKEGITAFGAKALGEPFVDFEIQSPPKGKSQWKVRIDSASAPSISRSEPKTIPLSSDSIKVSYTLSASGLPPCSLAVLRAAESGEIKNLEVKPLDPLGKIKLEQSAPKSAAWSALISPIPPSGSFALEISYEISDAKQWVNLTMPIVYETARIREDAQAQKLAEQAKQAADLGDWGKAVYLLQKAKDQLDKSAKSIPATQSLNDTINSASLALSKLEALSLRLQSSDQRPSWAGNIASWRQKLNSSIKEAQDSPTEDAEKKVSQQLGKIYQSSLEIADKDYSSLLKSLNSLRLTSLDDELVRSRLDEADSAMVNVREKLQAEDGIGALSALLEAHSAFSRYQKELLDALSRNAKDQESNSNEIKSKLELTKKQVDQYVESLTQLSAAGKSTYTPAISLTAAKSLQSKLQKVELPSIDFSGLPQDPAAAIKKITASQEKLKAANATVSSAAGSIAKAQEDLQAAAQNRFRVANAYLAEIKSRPSLASSPAATRLQEDAGALADMIERQKWPDAIVAGESIITRAKRLLDSDTSQETKQEPPFLIIIITVLLLIGIGIIILRSRPPKEKPLAQRATKTLGRLASTQSH